MPKGAAQGNRNSVGAQNGVPSRYEPHFAEIAARVCDLGATDRDLCVIFRVEEPTINVWKLTYPDFAKALKLGKEIPDERVKRSFYNKAIGYSYTAEEIYIIEGEVVRVKVIKHVPPDARAAAIWLNNRQRKEWSAPQKLEHSGPDGSPLPAANITIDARTAILADLSTVEKRLKQGERNSEAA